MNEATARRRVREHFAEFIRQTEPYPDCPDKVAEVWGEEVRAIADALTADRSPEAKARKNARRGATVKVNCAFCGGMFEARVADRNRGWGKTCSKRCAAMLPKNGKAKADNLSLPDQEAWAAMDAEDDHRQAMDAQEAGERPGGFS